MLLTIALAGTASAGDDDRFRGLTGTILEGFANPVPMNGDPCILINEEEATLLAVGLGRFDWVSTEVARLVPGPDVDPDCPVPEGAEIEGEFTITAKNGDEIRGIYRTVARIDVMAVEITFVGHYRITGGTGRFARAKGRGVITGRGDFLPPFEVTGQLVAQLPSNVD